MEIWETLGAYGIGAAALVFALKFILPHVLDRDLEKFKSDLQQAHESFKSSMQHTFDRDLERFRTDLQRTAELELERERAELRRRSFEHETQFSFLHAERAKVILEMYRRLARAKSLLLAVSSSIQIGDPSRLFPETGEAVWAFQSCADENVVLLDDQLAAKLEPVRKALHSIWITASHGEQHKGAEYEWEAKTRAFKEAEGTLLPQLAELEGSFRAALGMRHGAA